jgi:hypothetical protein
MIEKIAKYKKLAIAILLAVSAIAAEAARLIDLTPL